MKCSKCGRHLQNTSGQCPNCGEPVVHKLKKSHSEGKIILAAVLTVVVIAIAATIVFSKGNYTLKKEELLNGVDSLYNKTTDIEEVYWAKEDDYEEQMEGELIESSPVTEVAATRQEQQAVPVEQGLFSNSMEDAESEEYEYANESAFDEDVSSPEWVEEFYYDYRADYSEALNTLDFWKVEVYLSTSGTAYSEMQQYIYDIKDYGNHFNFYENRIIDYYKQNDRLFIETYEAFDMTDRDGATTSNERDKVYQVILNYNDYPVKIDSIEITNYYR